MSNIVKSGTYTVVLERIDDGVGFRIPEEILQELGWNEGTPVRWIDQRDGTFAIVPRYTYRKRFGRFVLMMIGRTPRK